MNETEEMATISLEDLMSYGSSRLDKSRKLGILTEAIQLLINLKSKVVVQSEMGNTEYPIIEDPDNRETIELWIMELTQLFKDEAKGLFKPKKKNE